MNTELLLLHGATQQALSSVPLRHVNDFGAEYEVRAHTHTQTSKNHGLQAERIGAKTGFEASRKEHKENHWAILTAATIDRERLLHRDAQQTLSFIQDMIATIQQQIRQHGTQPIHTLSTQLYLHDTHREDCLPYNTFIQILQQCIPAIQWSAEDAELFCNHYDRVNDGRMDYRVFLRQVREAGGRGSIWNDRRKANVLNIFNAMDQYGEDRITLPTLLSYTRTPQYKTNVTEAFNELQEKLGGISSERFVDYYTTLSSQIERDEDFIQLLQQTWQVKC